MVIIRLQYKIVAIQACGVGLASTWPNAHRLGFSAQDGILVRWPAMLKFHDFMLPMVSYEAYLSLHLFGAEFILDGG